MRLLRRLGAAARNLWVSLLMVVVLAIVTAAKIYFASSSRRLLVENASGEHTSRPAVTSKERSTLKDKAPRTVTEEFGEKFANFVLPPPPAVGREAPKGPPPIPDDVKKQLINAPTPISLFPPRIAQPADPPVPPTYYLPSFRVIRCELIAGPQTGAIETPLIGIVLDNQYNIDSDGVSRLVVPAGVEVHGIGKASPVRDRIDGNGKWTLVWRNEGDDNGMELSVSALALNRDYDEGKKAYGDLEKSPGIVGRRFESVGDKAIEEALLDSVASITRSLKSYTQVLNPLTSQIVTEQKPTVGNALLEGAGAGTDRVAQMFDDIRKEIDEKGYYVAVLPGKEFYLYTKEPIDLRKARRPKALVLSDKLVANPAEDGEIRRGAISSTP